MIGQKYNLAKGLLVRKKKGFTCCAQHAVEGLEA